MAPARHRVTALSALLAATTALAPATTRAQSTIKKPGDRPDYRVELEPHALLGPFDPSPSAGGLGYGLGFRGSLELLEAGFLPPLNDSVGVGLGADFVRYPDRRWFRSPCGRYVSGPAGTNVCVEPDGYEARRHFLYVPIVMQWSFWLHRKWSVFGEPGLALVVSSRDLDFEPFVFFAGGRFHATERVTVTLRLGYPLASLGVSFLL